MEEVWVEVTDYPNYAVSNRGEVVNLKTEALLRPRPNRQGYLRVALSNEGKIRDFYVHQLVAQAFKPNFKLGEQLLHVNGDFTDNRPENLHPRKYIREASAERRRLIPNERLRNSRRVKIKETGQVFRTVRECADYIGGDYSSIYSCLRGERKRHLGYTYEYYF